METGGEAGGGAGRWFGRRLEPLLYLGPALVLIALVMVLPLVIGISYAFQSISLIGTAAPQWVGLANFERLWNDWRFWNAMRNTVLWTLVSVALQFLFGLGLALLLNRRFPGRWLVQALVLLPWAVPTFLIGLAWAWLFNPIIGPLPHWLFALGLLAAPESILADPGTALIGPIVANVWFGIPFFAVTLLAALRSIPADLYEAAAIDGATPWQSFARITLPFLAPMIAITVLLRTIWIANFADLVFIMTGGGPAGASQILPTYIFTTAFRKLDFGYASALALVLLALLLLYAVLLLRLRRGLLSDP